MPSFPADSPSVKRERSQVHDAYKGFLAEESTSVCAAAIKALTEDIRRSSATTLMGLRDDLMTAGEVLKQCDDAPISIESLCELFVRFVTRTALDVPDFDKCKSLLVERGQMFAQKADMARDRIAQLGAPFVTPNAVVLTHGYSRMVLGVLLGAAERGCHFSVVVAESHARGRGHATAAALSAANVPVAMIEDCAVAHAMGGAQLAICGAEAVVESGGVISQTGTYQIAIVASACKKPFYVAAESTKFARKFPLSQLDLPATRPTREHAAYVGRCPPPETLRVEVTSRDYTPPHYITMLFTDLGVLTPSAVSDELIKLFT